VTRTWIERHILDNGGKVSIESPGGGENGFEIGEKAVADSGALFLPKLCNQCSDPPCVRYCPVGAMFRTDDGFVLTDPSRCIGCALCVKACPYGARFKNPVIGISGGCDWCHQRVIRRLDPVCVRVCPTRARVFGSGSSGKPGWISSAKPLDAGVPWKTGARVIYSLLGPKSDV
jgi:Fe-S-cluster-containing dehydrogenase component